MYFEVILINLFMVFNELENGLKYYLLIISEEMCECYMLFFDVVKEEYENIVKNEV